MSSEYSYFIFSSQDWKYVAKYSTIFNTVVAIAVGIITRDLELAELTFFGLGAFLGYQLYETQQKNRKLRLEAKKEPTPSEADKQRKIVVKLSCSVDLASFLCAQFKSTAIEHGAENVSVSLEDA